MSKIKVQGFSSFEGILHHPFKLVGESYPYFPNFPLKLRKEHGFLNRDFAHLKGEGSMSIDHDYLALTQIERGMENEISTFSSSDSRLETYLRTMEHAPSLQINGVLKVFSMLAARDEKIGHYESADAAYTWMYALCRGQHSKLYHHMFPSIRYEEEIMPQFIKEANWSQDLEMQESKEAWQMITLTTLACGLLMALDVLLLHFNFVVSLILILAIYASCVFYYCLWLRQRSVLKRLEELRMNMNPTLQRFAQSIPLTNHPLYPSYEDRLALRSTLRNPSIKKKEPERNINGLTKAEVKAQRKAKRQAQSNVVFSSKAPLANPASSPTFSTQNSSKSVESPAFTSSSRLSIFVEEEVKEKAKQEKQAPPAQVTKAKETKKETKASTSSKKQAPRSRYKSSVGSKRFSFFSSKRVPSTPAFRKPVSNQTYKVANQSSPIQ